MTTLSPEAVRSIRQKLGMTQSDLADAIGLSPATGRDTVRSWETAPSAKRARSISGPAAFALMALLDQWRPPPLDDWESIALM